MSCWCARVLLLKGRLVGGTLFDQDTSIRILPNQHPHVFQPHSWLPCFTVSFDQIALLADTGEGPVSSARGHHGAQHGEACGACPNGLGQRPPPHPLRKELHGERAAAQQEVSMAPVACGLSVRSRVAACIGAWWLMSLKFSLFGNAGSDISMGAVGWTVTSRAA